MRLEGVGVKVGNRFARLLTKDIFLEEVGGDPEFRRGGRSLKDRGKGDSKRGGKPGVGIEGFPSLQKGC